MIEIITYHKSVNYGALLQSLSLKEFIENQFKTKVCMCEYHPKKLLFAEYYRPMLTKKIDKLFQTIQKNYKIQRWKKKAFGKNVLINRNKIKLNIYGSDEIWNFSNAYHGYDPFYFGQNNNQTRPTSDLSIDEAYKILGIKKGCSKDEVILSAKKLQLKIHPDIGNPNSEYLSKLVNSSKDLILKTDFS